VTSSSSGFRLDDFQVEAMAHIDAGSSVVVAAPTGSGKTVIAEHAIDRALAVGRRAFYTAPIKALSNQKFADLSMRIGRTRVGLLTGDNTINGDGDVVVMTTEVLRNMLYEGRDLDSLDVVVLDEVHYLEDTYRGPVWEEVILNLPSHVRLVCLSATVSNAEEVRGWLEAVRGTTELVVETKRPVELTNLYVVGERKGARLHVIDTLVDGNPNPEGHRYDPDLRRQRDKSRKRSQWTTPHRLDIIDMLEKKRLLPTIWFVFSRKGCDEAADVLARSGARFTSREQAREIRELAEARLASLDESDLRLLDSESWLTQLERGIASHHAGLVPAFKESIEVGFAKGLVKVVFATETLALGVNLPARSVVIDKLSKFTGETHEILTPAQFTQITGRAGRRGIDETGHALVPWSPFVTFDQVARLAASRSFKLRSAFRPNYNMAVNLLDRHNPDEARALLARSFAQYQSNSELTRLEARLIKERERVTDLERSADAAWDIPDDDRPAGADRPDEINDAITKLRPGDLVKDPDGNNLAVMGVSRRKGKRARIRLVSTGGHDIHWDSAELTRSPHTVGHIDLPKPHAPDRPDFRADVASRIRRLGPKDTARRRSRNEQSPAHLRADLSSARKEVERIRRLSARHRGSIPRQFDAICDVLHRRGYLHDWQVTDSGHLLGRIYHELDLLVADSLVAGAFDGLRPAELASVVSTFTYEHRRPGPPPDPRFPSPKARAAHVEISAIASDLRRVQRKAGVPRFRSPDGGFAAMAHSWASGEDLAVLLDADDLLTPGDFVRNIKQLTDLLRQLSSIATNGSTRSSAAAAVESINRGVVAASGAIDQP